MTILPPLSLRSIRRLFGLPALFGLALAALVGVALYAQVGGDRGIAPVASSTDIDIGNIRVDVGGETSEDARHNGWRRAQRLAWEKLGGPDIPDSRLDSLVSAIVVQEEELGPRRYIATLGVIFDRTRAGALLGGGGERSRSAPMLTLPVLMTGGTQIMFETRNVWQNAWAQYQTGASTIDYVRPSGAGWESLLLTYGQTGRRSRAWWNEILDQFGAADVLVPIARLDWQWPGGPVTGTFTARYGPDNRMLTRFELEASGPEQLPEMLTRAVERLDRAYMRALAEGRLTPDPTLTLENLELSDQAAALIEAAREAEQAAIREAEGDQLSVPETPPGATPVETETVLNNFVVQVATPDPASFDAALTSVRGTPGVRSVATGSLAIGGTSVLRVGFAGDLATLAAALRTRGWTVTEGSNALGISR